MQQHRAPACKCDRPRSHVRHREVFERFVDFALTGVARVRWQETSLVVPCPIQLRTANRLLCAGIHFRHQIRDRLVPTGRWRWQLLHLNETHIAPLTEIGFGVVPSIPPPGWPYLGATGVQVSGVLRLYVGIIKYPSGEDGNARSASAA